MEPHHNNRELSRNRRLVSQLLVAALFAVAYSQMVSPVTAAFDRDGVNLQTLAWPVIYMMTVLRFFIGNILHLESPNLIGPKAAFRWFWDLFFIVMQCVVLIFAGAVATVNASAGSTISFTDYLLVLYGLDVLWLVSMRVLHWLGQAWPRFFGPMVRDRDLAPLEWAIVNVILGLVIWGVDLAGTHSADIDAWKLWLLVGVNAAVFLDDLVDIAYGIREPEGRGCERIRSANQNSMVVRSDYVWVQGSYRRFGRPFWHGSCDRKCPPISSRERDSDRGSASRSSRSRTRRRP